MITDFRMSVGYFTHPKIVMLKHRLKEAGVLAHIQLLAFAAQWKPDGRLVDMTSEAIAIAAGWTKDAEKFVSALVEFRLLDNVDGCLAIHDWERHNAFAVDHEKRSAAARKNAQKRWNRHTDGDPDDDKGDANGMRMACESHTDGNAPSIETASGPHANGNAPFVSSRLVSSRSDPSPDSVPPAGETTPEKPAPVFHEDADRLAHLLADLIERNGSKRPNVTKTWLQEIDRMIRIDKRTPANIEAAIKWCQASEFWRANIMSPAKLREKYDTLRLQAQREAQALAKPAQNVPDDEIAKFLAQRGGQA